MHAHPHPTPHQPTGTLGWATPQERHLFLKVLFIYLFIYLWLRLGLRCCTRVFSSCSEWELLFDAVRGFLVAVASLIAEHGL